MKNITYIKRFLIIACIITSAKSSGQQLPLYSQYMLNGFLLNPAVAGADGYTAVNLTAREQWMGREDAPATYSLSAQTRLLKRSYVIKRTPIKNKNTFKPSRSGRVGIGGGIFNDRNGHFQYTGLQMTYAYHIPFNNAQLSFGLSGIASQFRIDRNNLDPEIDEDHVINNLSGNYIAYVPDADVGMYYLTYDYYFGLSVKNVFQSPLKIGSSQFSNVDIIRNYHIMGGYKYYHTNDLVLEPSVLVKMNENLEIQADMNLLLYFMEEYWTGVSFRTDKTFITLIGVKFNNVFFGYSYDYSFSSIRKHIYGSHEVFLAMKFGDSARRYRWLHRY